MPKWSGLYGVLIVYPTCNIQGFVYVVMPCESEGCVALRNAYRVPRPGGAACQQQAEVGRATELSGCLIARMDVWPQMAAFGVQDVHAASHWGGLPAAETPEGARSAAAAPAPAAAGLAGLAEKLLGPAKVMNGSLPAAFREVDTLCPTSIAVSAEVL